MFPVIARRIAVILLVALSLFLSVQNLVPQVRVALRRPNIGTRNEVSIWENRFDPVRDGLPPGIERVGYISELDLLDEQYIPVQTNEFRMTRYVMAPTIVNLGADEPWIIGNFSSYRNFEDHLLNKIGPYEIQEFSGGIYLIHKVEQ